ncbi:hypothetical protein TNCV_3033401 [Trichonephila clavipes]|nr:hypothetical protein TNCV_3033401 [Trichonephila clavipes]
MGERRIGLSGLLQYLHNDISNGTVPSSINYRILIMELLERLDVPNPTALLTPHATVSIISNKVTLEIDSHSDSITESICTQKPSSVAEELDKVIKEGYAPQNTAYYI